MLTPVLLLVVSTTLAQTQAAVAPVAIALSREPFSSLTAGIVLLLP